LAAGPNQQKEQVNADGFRAAPVQGSAGCKKYQAPFSAAEKGSAAGTVTCFAVKKQRMR
jgi:hypothetical protein